jgi:fimbrial isopeptide formation D2 family protein
MGILKKGRISILTVAILFVLLFVTEFCSSSFQVVWAAEPESGAFYLKKYVNVSEQREAAGVKEDTDDPSNSLYGKEVVPGVEYEIYRTHDYRYARWIELEEAAAVLDGERNYKTDANGEINIRNLPLGRYVFKEVSAPEGIQVNTEEYYFTLPYTNAGETKQQYEVYVYPKNVQLTGSLSFQKVGDNGTDGLKNVKFAVYHEDGSAVKDSDGNDLTVTTRLSGSAVIEDLKVGKYYLLETENPDTDYLESSTTKYWFQIYADGNNMIKSKSFYTDDTMANKIEDADGKALADGTVINYKVPDVKKTASAKNEQDIKDERIYVDADGNLYANVDIPYAYTITTTLPKDLAAYTKFEIYDAFDQGNIDLVTDLKDIVPVAIGGNSQLTLSAGEHFTVVQEGSAGYRLKFTDRGIAALAAAKCTAVEVTFDAKIPKGYQVKGNAKQGENNDAIVDFDTDHSDPSVSSTTNTVYPRAGEIIIHKIDGSNQNKLLAGAEFSLKDADGNEYWGTDHIGYLDVNGKVTSDVKKAATFIFSQLPFGTYTLKETTAPSGYTINANETTIKLLQEDDETATWLSQEKYFENTKIGESSTSGSVKTGDAAKVLLYILGLLGGSISITALVLYYQKKK